jgi:hypothetical protein
MSDSLFSRQLFHAAVLIQLQTAPPQRSVTIAQGAVRLCTAKFTQQIQQETVVCRITTGGVACESSMHTALDEMLLYAQHKVQVHIHICPVRIYM